MDMSGALGFRVTIVCFLAFGLRLGSAAAGPHANGILIPHLNPTLEYSYGVEFQGQSRLRSCREAVTEGRVDPEEAQVWFILASFEDSPGPVELGGATFGFGSFDPSKINFSAFAPCNDEFLELPSPGWPGPNQGTAILFEEGRAPRSDLIELYWFATYVYGPVSIEVAEDPQSGSMYFGTVTPASGPPLIDEVYDWGMIGFGEEGYNPCNWSPQPGACCVGDMCYLVLRDECTSLGGNYGGDNSDCFPNPCDRPAVELPWGQLKRLYRGRPR